MTMIMPGTGLLRGKTHVYPVRVYIEDTDAAGIVYYANYLKYAERARTEMMRMLGFDHGRMVLGPDASGPASTPGPGMTFAVRHCAVDYLRPARLDDSLQVLSTLIRLGGASLAMRQRVSRDGESVAVVDIKLVCMTLDGRAVRVPEEVRDLIESYVTDEERS